MITPTPPAFVGYGIDREVGLFIKVCGKCDGADRMKFEASIHGIATKGFMCARHEAEAFSKRFGETNQ